MSTQKYVQNIIEYLYILLHYICMSLHSLWAAVGLTAKAPNVLPLKIDKKTCSKSEPQKKGGENVKDCRRDNVYNHIFEKNRWFASPYLTLSCFDWDFCSPLWLGYIQCLQNIMKFNSTGARRLRELSFRLINNNPWMAFWISCDGESRGSWRSPPKKRVGPTTKHLQPLEKQGIIPPVQ